MPYKRAKSQAPNAIGTEWQGTCSGKHYLLKELFQEMGIGIKVFMCTHRFDGDNTAHFPQSLRELTAEGPRPRRAHYSTGGDGQRLDGRGRHLPGASRSVGYAGKPEIRERRQNGLGLHSHRVF